MRCEWWDSGWCYHKDVSRPYACDGIVRCTILNKENKMEVGESIKLPMAEITVDVPIEDLKQIYLVMKDACDRLDSGDYAIKYWLKYLETRPYRLIEDP